MEPNMLPAPNLNGKIYREFIPKQSVINKFLDFIDVDNGHVLLGSTNLNGRYWTGSVCFYKDFNEENRFDIENTNLFVCLDDGVIDGKFLPNNNRIIVAQDSGAVKIYDIEEDGLKLINKNTIDEHDEAITEISLWPNTKEFLTSSTDASIKVWQMKENDELACIHHYNCAHANIISSVNASPTDANLFVSSSYDRTALLWDVRIENNATVVYENEFCALTRIQWHHTKPNIVAVGTSSGDVYLVDVRVPKEFISKNSTFTKSIHKIAFNSRDLVAVCADDSLVAVMDTAEDMRTIYLDDYHNDFVRGLVWKDNILISCAWDKQVQLHFV